MTQQTTGNNLSITDNIFSKRGTWQLFQTVGDYDLSVANIAHVDHQGRLWLRLPDALLCTDGRHVINSHTAPTLKTPTPGREGFSGNDKFWFLPSSGQLYSLKLDDGSVEEHTHSLPPLDDAQWLRSSKHEDILIGYSDKVVRYDGNQTTTFELNEGEYGKLRSATVSPDGDCWITTYNHLFRVVDGELHKIPIPDFRPGSIWDVIAEENGVAWTPTMEGLLRVTGDKVETLAEKALGKALSFTTLLIDSERNFWFSLHFRGTVCVNESESVMFPLEDTPGHSCPKCIVQDRTGAYWLIGVGNGIVRYDPCTLDVVQRGYLEAATMGADGTLRIAAASKGLLEYDGATSKRLYLDLPIRCFCLSLSKDDDLYVSSPFGLASYDPDRSRLVNVCDTPGLEALRDKSVSMLVWDHEDCLWVNTPHELFRLNPSGLKSYPKSDLELDARIFIYRDSAATLWFFGNGESPVYTFGPDGFKRWPATLGEWFGIGGDHATACCEDADGDLWIGSTTGVVARCNPKEGTVELELELRKGIRDVRFDDDGRKWISTSDGLFVIDDENTYRMTEDCLLPSRRVFATYPSDDGRVMILTELGLCNYRPNRNIRPEVLIAKVVADKVHVLPQGKITSETRPVVSIELTAVNMKLGPLVYQVRLVGHDDQWHETSQEEFRFENLPVGNYRFEAKAFDQDLMTCAKVAAVDIEIKLDTREIQISELESELRDAEDFADNIFRSINDAIIVLSADGLVATANDAALSLLGYGLAAVVGRPAETFFAQQAGPLFGPKGLERLKRKGHFRAREVDMLDDNGDHHPVMLTASSMQDRGGKFQGFVLAASDIAEYKALQAQVLHNQKMESLGMLASGVAHDFKNLLSVILGNAELVRADMREGSDHHACLSDVLTAGRQAAKLCSELLAYSGNRQQSHRALELSEIVRENANLLKSSISRKISIEYDFEDGLPKILGDDLQLMQVIMNLVINAADAIGDRAGTIALSTRTARVVDDSLVGELSHAVVAPGNYVMLTVRDSGCGMDKVTLQRIFEPFFTTKPTGRGLGLAAMHGIIKSHNGGIKVDSKPGKGTTFHIYLPVFNEGS